LIRTAVPAAAHQCYDVAMKSVSSRLSAVILALACIATGAAEAQAPQAQPGQPEKAVSGRELLAGCEQGDTSAGPNQYCMRYVFGLVQTVLMVQKMSPKQEPLFCIDPRATSLQEVTVTVTNWLRNRQDRLDEDAYKLVSEALHQHYACGRT